MRLLVAIACLAVLPWAACGESTPRAVLPSGWEDARQPQVAAGPDGMIYVVFAKGPAIYLSKSSDGGSTFAPPALVGQLPGLLAGMRRGPRVAAADKELMITAISSDLFSWRSTDGGTTWSKPLRINDVPKSAHEGLHNLAVSSDGRFFVVWLDLRERGHQVWGSRWLPGAARWSPNTKVYSSPDGHVCECCHPSVAFAPGGKVFVMWRNWLGGARNLYVADSDDGAAFGKPQKQGRGNWKLDGCPMDGGAIGFQSGDTLTTVWQRDGRVYESKGETETLVGTGTQPVFVAGPLEECILWQTGGNIMMKLGANPRRTLARNAQYPAVASRGADKPPVAVWETTKEGVSPIQFAVLE